MTNKPRIDGLRIAGIVFGLVIPLPLTLYCSLCASYILLPALFAARVALQQRLFLTVFLLWALAGWAGLASLFSILKRRDYYLRSLSLWQVSGLVVCIIAASPWIIIGFNGSSVEEPLGWEYLVGFSMAGPIIVAVVCLVKLKWKIRKRKTETSLPTS